MTFMAGSGNGRKRLYDVWQVNLWTLCPQVEIALLAETDYNSNGMEPGRNRNGMLRRHGRILHGI